METLILIWAIGASISFFVCTKWSFEDFGNNKTQLAISILVNLFISLIWFITWPASMWEVLKNGIEE